MPTHILNRILPAVLRSKLRRFALSAIPSMRHLDMPRRLRNLRSIGLDPATIVDVGAAQGHWARLAAQIWPQAAIFGVEPNETNLPMLEQTVRELPRFSYRRGFLGPEPGLRRYTDESDQTSLLNPNATGGAEQQAPMFTLDGLIAEGALSPPQLIKLDVQGYELEVLKGAEQALKTCDAILTEVSFFPFFPKLPLVDEVIAFLRVRGFIWYDALGILRRSADDRLAQMDFLFLREGHPLLADSRMS
jgi:FkbM family methyltransferase